MEARPGWHDHAASYVTAPTNFTLTGIAADGDKAWRYVATIVCTVTDKTKDFTMALVLEAGGELITSGTFTLSADYDAPDPAYLGEWITSGSAKLDTGNSSLVYKNADGNDFTVSNVVWEWDGDNDRYRLHGTLEEDNCVAFAAGVGNEVYVRLAFHNSGTLTVVAGGYQFGGFERYVEIAGVMWATRNVNAPGTFAAKPEDAGMFYQWNRRIGWSADDPLTSSPAGQTWDNTLSTGDSWDAANDPCPAGWRVPTLD